MADVAAKAPKTVKAKASKGEKKPTTQALIKEAILALKERSGSSPAAIKKYLASKGLTVDASLLNRELKKATAKGTLVKVKGSYKLSVAAKKAPAKPKKVVKTNAKPKKETAPKVKKVSEKKSTAPKTTKAAASKPKTVKPKKAATKKPATKKVAAKKPPTKSTATKKTAAGKAKKPTTKKTSKKAGTTKPAKTAKA